MNDPGPRVRLYTKRWCAYCIAARRLLRRLGVRYRELPVDHDAELRRRASEAAGGWPTVPLIFIDDRFIGGYRELRALHDRGALRALRDAAASPAP